MARIADWMTPTPITLNVGEPLHRAALLMSRHGIRHLPIIGAGGALAGLVTDYAIFGRGVLVGGESDLWFPYARDGLDACVDSVMERVEIVVGADDDLAGLLRRLVDAGQDAMVVVDAERHPIGILTEHDPVRYAAGLIDPRRPASMDASSPVQTVDLASSLRATHRLMLERGFRHLVVVDRRGVAETVLSYRDVVAAEVHSRGEATVGDAVRGFHLHWRSVRGATTVSCAELMAKERIGCVPLLDDHGAPAAIVTRVDIADAVAVAFEEEELFDIV